MIETIPQDDALTLQLAMIAGAEPRSSRWEIRRLSPNRPAHQIWVPLTEPDRAARAIQNQSQIGNTFVGAAPRVREGGKAKDVERIWCLWADLDSLESLQRLAAFEPLPSMVIRTGTEHHAHAYWQLRESLPGAWAQRANRRLSRELRSDPASTDPARVLRPAGTRNFKHEPTTSVVCTRLELDAFTMADVIGGLPDDRDYKPVAKPQALIAASPSKTLDGLVRKVAENGPGSKNRNNALHWAGCRLREHVDEGRLNETEGREALRQAAISAGLGETEIDRTLDSALNTEAAA